jgi:hypothetical protein
VFFQSRGRTRVKTQLGNSRLPIEAKWRDPDAAEYYENPGVCIYKINKFKKHTKQKRKI